MIYSASRLQYVLHELESLTSKQKRIRFVHGMLDKPAKLVLIESIFAGSGSCT